MHEGYGGPDGRGTVAELARRAQQGDALAFACLVEQYQVVLIRFCRRMLSDSHAAQDLLQETLLRAYQSLPRLEEPSRFSAWLFGIAANLARQWWRTQAHAPLSLERLAATYPELPWDAVLPLGSTPDQVVEAADRSRRLLEAIGALPAALGQVVVLYYLEGWSYADMAAALDVPVSTIKGRLFKARAKLRRELTAAGILPWADTIGPAHVKITRPTAPPAGAGGLHEYRRGGPVMAGRRRRDDRAPEQPPPEGTPERQAAPEPAPAPAQVSVQAQAERVIADRLKFLEAWHGTPGQFGGFTEAAKRVLVAAEEEAQQLNHHYLGTEHLLLGLLRDEGEIAARVLAGMGVTLDRVREIITFRIKRGNRPADGPLPLVPRMKKVIDLALAEVFRLKHTQLGPEHLLLGLVREGSGVGALILESLGLDLEEVRRQVLDALGPAQSHAGT